MSDTYGTDALLYDLGTLTHMLNDRTKRRSDVLTHVAKIAERVLEQDVDEREERAARRATGTLEIEGLSILGYTVRKLTKFHFRVNNSLDLYPTGMRYQFLPTGERGDYADVGEVLRRFMPEKEVR